MKKKMLGGLVVGILSIWVWHKWHASSVADANAAPWVQVTKVKKLDLPMEVAAIGTLVARSVEITPEVAGHVQAVLFQDGVEVKEGTALVQLDDSIYRAKYDSAMAKLAYSENNYKRMLLLGKQGAIAKQAIDQAEADLKECQADAKENEVTLNKMRLVAPFTGVVGKTKVNPGDYVNIGQGLVTLTDTQHLHVEFNLPENDLALLHLGEEVRVLTSAYPDKYFYGKIAYISPTVNTENRSVSLYAEMPNEKKLLEAGMFVNVVQSLGAQEKSLWVPARSLVPALEGEQVYRVVNGKALVANVTVGKRTEENVQILKGLSDDDMVVTDGQMKIQDGSPIQFKS